MSGDERSEQHPATTIGFEPQSRAGTKRGQSGAVSGGRGLPPDHDSPNENGPCCLLLSRAVWLQAAHNPKVGGSNPPQIPLSKPLKQNACSQWLTGTLFEPLLGQIVVVHRSK